jgi:hypothetical protein
MALNIMTQSITTLSIITISIMALSIRTLRIALSIKYIKNATLSIMALDTA